MDYRALAELVFFAFIGLSVFTLVTSLSFHFVLRPFLESVFVGRKEQRELGDAVLRRLEALEHRVVELDAETDRLRTVQEFDRQLGSGGDGEADRAPRREEKPSVEGA